MKKFLCSILVMVVLMVSMVVVAQAEGTIWGLYTEKSVGEWLPLKPGEIIEVQNLGNLMVANIAKNQKVHWRWMNAMKNWVELEEGNPFVNIDGYRASHGWDVLELQVMDGEGIYHAVGKYPVRFESEGDFYMNTEDAAFVSWGDGTVGISMSYEYDIEIKTISNVTLVTFEKVPAGNIVVGNVDIGDVIIVVGRDGDNRSLPMLYQVSEGDFALVNND